jgi:hypothetical protein
MSHQLVLLLRIDPKQVLTINEQRRMLDEDLPMLEEGNMFLTDREQIIVTRDDADGGDDEAGDLQVTEIEKNNYGKCKQYIPLVTAAEVISNSFTNANTDPALISNNTILLSELAHIKEL